METGVYKIMSKKSLENIKNIHFVGIGGSGMCPLAEILLSKGYNITGSDCNESDTLDRIRSYGITVIWDIKWKILKELIWLFTQQL